MERCRIILVDDDSDDADMLKTALENMPQVSVQAICCSYDEFVAALSSAEPPNLVVCDVHMPLKGGIEICGELYTIEAYKNIPVVLLSGSRLTPAVTNAAMQYNVAGIFIKPDDLQGYKALAARLAEICIAGKNTGGIKE